MRVGRDFSKRELAREDLNSGQFGHGRVGQEEHVRHTLGTGDLGRGEVTRRDGAT